MQHASVRPSVVLLTGPKATGQTNFTNNNMTERGVQHRAVLPRNTRVEMWLVLLESPLFSQPKPDRGNYPAHSPWAGNEEWENMFDHKGARYTE